MKQFVVVADQLQILDPDKVALKGLIGKRLEASCKNRLRLQEEYHLLWSFIEHCPLGWKQDNPPHPEITRGDWQGEFIGTWIDAACKTAWYLHDEVLHAKIENLIGNWLNTQEDDGYLGTYDEKDRWKSWDIWIQAHDLIGLISYYQYTGSEKTLKAATRVANRVLSEFGPGKRDLHTGPHQGMASSAILEPIIWLYWISRDKRFLEFAQWLVDQDWETPGGPQIISSLLSGHGVAETANAKAAEMLICLTGLLELYRATGEQRYLASVVKAWEDIVQHHLYITGSASIGEYFQKDFSLHNDGFNRTGETCVTMTWLYLNLSLGRLTGEARYFDRVEQALYNHLLSAQSPDGKGWAYYVGLRDSKRFRWHTDPDCCPTRGVRALAQIPSNVMHISEGGLTINFYEDARVHARLFSGDDIEIRIKSQYPFDGNITLIFAMENSKQFSLSLRLPGWCQIWHVKINNGVELSPRMEKGYLILDQVWQNGDQITLSIEMPVSVVEDRLGNHGRIALMRGPLVFAVDKRYLPYGKLLDDVTILLRSCHLTENIRIEQAHEMDSVRLVAPILEVKPVFRIGIWKTNERYLQFDENEESNMITDLPLVPFFEAGSYDEDAFKDGVWSNFEAVTKATYQVWLPYKIVL